MELGSTTEPEPILPTTMISANIRGLNPGMSYSKIEYMTDISKENNAVIISLTESHLHEGILDSEINIKDWTNVRSDRRNRSGGGVIVYVKDKYTISCEDCYSNSVCESICLYINELNIGIITIYRPPNSGNSEFLLCLNRIEEWMKEIYERSCVRSI